MYAPPGDSTWLQQALTEGSMKRLELAIESIILASRWLLVAFYLGLAVALAVYALSFGKKLFEFTTNVMVLHETDTILKILGLIDAALVASLVVMVIISGYENFVSRFDNHDGEVHWLGTIDVGSLKIKVASTIVAISSIHLLQVFLNHASYTSEQIMWLTLMHLTFVVSAFILAYIDRITGLSKKGGKDLKAPQEPGL
ncbi:uncharacterized protein (TIGR00645 family) [Pseudaminobacter salicylatoxidans]|uniref:UPF0114 protein C7441_112108 n=2 Tax=Pseudaminobacter salicylatoxidans TaxID=93369 RepID=A0A316BZN0_PSESE|nr:uncharacterized protein (TIGR00645 family) [Pseudaminobacter salicylatoxidans]